MYEMLEVVEPELPRDGRATSWASASPTTCSRAVRRGVDLFDCVAPTRNGRNGTVWVEERGAVQHQAPAGSARTRPAGPGVRLLHLPDVHPGVPPPPVRRGRGARLRLLSLHNVHFLLRLAERRGRRSPRASSPPGARTGSRAIAARAPHTRRDDVMWNMLALAAPQPGGAGLGPVVFMWVAVDPDLLAAHHPAAAQGAAAAPARCSARSSAATRS